MDALHDVKVVDIATVLAGPNCARYLADFGADVVKIEPPGDGDPMRNWGREKAEGASLWWPVVARNKKAITLDMRQMLVHEAHGQYGIALSDGIHQRRVFI